MSMINFHDPTVININLDDNAQPVSLPMTNETKQVVDGKIPLEGLPDEQYRIKITGYVEINIKDKIDAPYKFKCDYTHGILYFDQSKNGTSVNVDKYYSRGQFYIASSRVWTKISDLGEVEETLAEFVESGRVAVDMANDIKGILDNGELLKGELNSTISSANTSKSNLETAIDNSTIAKSNLEESTLTANNTKTELDGSVSLAKSTKISLDESITNGDINTINNKIGILNGVGITKEKANKIDLDVHKAESVSQGVHGLKIEEGIFTPTIKGYTTPGIADYSNNKGFFTKINKTVHFDVVSEGTIIDATGIVFIGGLPFMSQSIDAQRRASCTIGQLSYLDFGTNLEVTAYVSPGDTGILLFFTKPSAGSDYVNITNFIDGRFGIRLSGTYTIN